MLFAMIYAAFTVAVYLHNMEKIPYFARRIFNQPKVGWNYLLNEKLSIGQARWIVSRAILNPKSVLNLDRRKVPTIIKFPSQPYIMAASNFEGCRNSAILGYV